MRFLDFYGNNITLTYKKEAIYKTTFGGILSLVTFSLILIYGAIALKDLIAKKNFKLISSISIDAKASFDFSNFPFMFGLANQEGLIEPDEKLFNFIITDIHYRVNKDLNMNKTTYFTDKELEFINCQYLKDNKTYFINSSFHYKNFSKYNCIKPGQNLTFYGKYGDLTNGFKGLRIHINKCNNKTSKLKINSTCYSLEEIDKKLNNLRFLFYFIGFGVEHYSTNDIHLYYEELSDSLLLSKNYQKAYFISFSKGIYFNDNSLIFNNIKQNIYYTLSTKTVDIDALNYNILSSNRITEDTIGFCSFNMDDNIIEYYKSYTKLTDFISAFGGVSNLFLIISQLINQYITFKIKTLDLIESLAFNNKDMAINQGNKNKEIKKSIDNSYFSINLQNNLKKNDCIISSNFPLKSNNQSNFLKINNYFIKNNLKKNKNKKSPMYLTNLKLVNDYLGKAKSNKFCLYLLPVFYMKKSKKYNYFTFLYNFLVKHLSIERMFNISKAWKNPSLKKYNEELKIDSLNRYISKSEIKRTKRNNNESKNI